MQQGQKSGAANLPLPLILSQMRSDAFSPTPVCAATSLTMSFRPS